MRSYNIKDAFIALLRESGMLPDEAWRISEGLCGSFNELMLGCLKPLPGAVELLSFMKGKALKLGLVTNGYADWQRKKLIISGLERFFPPEHIAISGELPRYCEKPAQFIYRQILDRLSLSHYKVAFVGDRATDILGANVAGMISIMVGTGRVPGYDKGFPLECPDLWVGDLAELHSIWSTL
jgi:HAD superfamily hydrolase (TIGR01549 family)